MKNRVIAEIHQQRQTVYENHAQAEEGWISLSSVGCESLITSRDITLSSSYIIISFAFYCSYEAEAEAEGWDVDPLASPRAIVFCILVESSTVLDSEMSKISRVSGRRRISSSCNHEVVVNLYTDQK